jgi:putative ABC transport system ATP-binding protein
LTVIIELDGVGRTYHMGPTTVRALDGVDLNVAAGEYVAIMGPSGSGKSTLMNLIGCLDTPTEGSYRLRGQEVGGMDDDHLAEIRNREIGFVFQTFHLLPRVDAVGNVELPLIYAGTPRDERRRRAERALVTVGLEDRKSHRPNELSGGQRQRVAIARALVQEPALLLADEPTGNLDSRTGAEILDLFDRLHDEGHTLLLVTHEEDVARRAGRVVRMLDGRIVSDEAPEGDRPGSAGAKVRT